MARATSDNASVSSIAPPVLYEADTLPVDPETQNGGFTGLVTPEVVNTIENVINIGVLPVLVTSGVITNVINLAVFKRQGLADRVNLCLFSLSLADLGYLVFIMARKTQSMVSLVDPLMGQYWTIRSLNTALGVYWGFMNVSSVLSMIISLERCACVLAPLHAKTLIRVRTMAALIASVFVFILVSCGLFNLRYIAVPLTDPASNRTLAYALGLSSFHLQNSAVTDAVFYIGVAVPVISLVVVIITTAITTTQLHLTVAWRKETAQQSVTDSREVALTKMLVAISILYVVCTTPKSIMPLIELSVPEVKPEGRYANIFHIMNSFVHVLSVINSSVNFIFYWALGSRYRATLHALCSCRCVQITARSAEDLQQQLMSHFSEACRDFGLTLSVKNAQVMGPRRMHWLCHVARMDDGRTSNDLLYAELVQGKHPTGRPKDICKTDLKALSIDLNTWEDAASQ
ncbi:uncharacterized protein LOC143280234 [Babylonia areolata]|uniref:uncharacterized protein LOC143280234 n=1 Tax=Babylonia areolata TaxID=304850 RepID=UPI003FD594CF